MVNNKNNIQSINAYITCVSSIVSKDTGRCIFRGQSNSSFPLDCSAKRRMQLSLRNAEQFGKPKSKDIKITNEKLIEYHRKLIENAKEKGFNNKDGMNLSDLELIADLQHFGCATMLIDFTWNSLIALYFAVKGDKKRDGAVFVININKKPFKKILNSISKGTSEIKNTNSKTPQSDMDNLKFDIDKISNDISSGDDKVLGSTLEYLLNPKSEVLWFWEPQTLNKRIPVQHSIFLCGESTINPKYYSKIIIDKKSKNLILNDLDKIFNISESSLFNDLIGFANVNSQYKNYDSITPLEHYNLGKKYYENGNFVYAVNCLDVADDLYLENDEIKIDIKFLLGMSLIKIKQTNYGIKKLEDVIFLDKKKEFKEAIIELGIAYFEADKYKDAIKILKSRSVPKTNLKVNYYIAISYFFLNDYVNVIKYIVSRSNIFSDKCFFNYLLGYSYAKQNQFDKAQKYMDFARSQASNEDSIYNRINKFYKNDVFAVPDVF